MGDLSQAELLKLALLWGPGLLILFGLYRLILSLGHVLKPFGEMFIAAQQGQAKALAAQAQATAALNQSFQDFISRDNAEHREMLILLKMISGDIRGFQDVKSEHDRYFNTDEAKCGGHKVEG